MIPVDFSKTDGGQEGEQLSGVGGLERNRWIVGDGGDWEEDAGYWEWNWGR